MSTFLYTLGHRIARNRWKVLVTWVLLAAAAFAISGVAGGQLVNDYSIPGTESQRGIDTLAQRFPQASGTTGQIVFTSTSGPIADQQAAIEAQIQAIDKVQHVTSVDDPFASDAVGTISPDKLNALSSIQFDVGVHRPSARSDHRRRGGGHPAGRGEVHRHPRRRDVPAADPGHRDHRGPRRPAGVRRSGDHLRLAAGGRSAAVDRRPRSGHHPGRRPHSRELRDDLVDDAHPGADDRARGRDRLRPVHRDSPPPTAGRGDQRPRVGRAGLGHRRVGGRLRRDDRHHRVVRAGRRPDPLPVGDGVCGGRRRRHRGPRGADPAAGGADPLRRAAPAEAQVPRGRSSPTRRPRGRRSAPAGSRW